MLHRTLDDSYPEVIRRDITTVTAARLTANAAYRFAPPFLATIARGLDVELGEIGVALAITELCGLSSPVLGRLVDRIPRRWSMTGGLLGVAAGAAIAGASSGIVMFTVGLFVLALTKIVFDVGLGAWITDHVAFDRRGRVVGVTETSWALGLLVGVSLMGLITAVASWRWGYAAAAVAVVVMAVVVLVRIDPGPRDPPDHAATRAPSTRLPRSGWYAVLALFGLMAASQAVFVTFGPWLEDRFDVGTAGLATVTFGLGALELVASSISAVRTDRWGKERSVIVGATVMVPAGLVLAISDQRIVLGLLMLGVFIAAFEFSIVSAIPIGGDLIPGAPGRGIGTMIACGTVGRAAMAIPATQLYERHGIMPAALLGSGAATSAGLAMLARLRRLADERRAVAAADGAQ